LQLASVNKSCFVLLLLLLFRFSFSFHYCYYCHYIFFDDISGGVIERIFRILFDDVGGVAIEWIYDIFYGDVGRSNNKIKIFSPGIR